MWCEGSERHLPSPADSVALAPASPALSVASEAPSEADEEALSAPSEADEAASAALPDAEEAAELALAVASLIAELTALRAEESEELAPALMEAAPEVAEPTAPPKIVEEPVVVVRVEPSVVMTPTRAEVEMALLAAEDAEPEAPARTEPAELVALEAPELAVEEN